MAAGSGGRYEAVDIVDAIIHARMQLWVVMEGNAILGVLTTEIIQYPRLRAMRGIGVVGHRSRRWMHLLANIEHAAKTHFGCDRGEMLHAPGDDRLLTTGGWRQWHILSEKVL